jgi:hypothetical protein
MKNKSETDDEHRSEPRRPRAGDAALPPIDIHVEECEKPPIG